jgi:D-alanyl-D-alanine dipeptidase
MAAFRLGHGAKIWVNPIALARDTAPPSFESVSRLIILALAALGCAPVLQPPGAPPVNTADLPIASDAAADSLLTDVQTLAPGIVVDLRYATANNFTGAPIAGYEGNHAYLRRPVAEALARVERDLAPVGLGLKIFDAYRPARATDAMVAWTKRGHREDLLRDGYIASKSRHNLGVAVDLTLIRLRDDSELEMGTPFDTFSAPAHTANASGETARNRQLLKAAMEREGFTNYDQEWWHFTFSLPDQRRFDRVIR